MNYTLTNTVQRFKVIQLKTKAILDPIKTVKSA